MSDWQLLQYGQSFMGADLLFIESTLNAEISENGYQATLTKKANKISKILKYNIGRGEWQVLFIKGRHSKKFCCSRNLFCLFQKKDGLMVYIQVNRFRSEEENEPTFLS